MVLPLLAAAAGLGALGLGGAAIAQPHMQNRSARVRGRYQDSLLDGIDRTDPAAVGNALFSGGILSGEQLQGDIRGAFEAEADRAAAMERQRVASAASLENARLNRERFEFERQRIAAQDQAVTAAMNAAGIDPILQGVPGVRRGYEDAVGARIEQIYGPQTRVNPVLAEEAAVRGDAWLDLEPGDRQDIIGVETAYQNITDVLRFTDQTTAAGRVASREDAERMRTLWNTSVNPFFQQLTDAGAMQEAEIELFREWGGDPFAWNNLTNAERGRVLGVLTRVQQKLASDYRSFGLVAPNLSRVPERLQPGPAPVVPEIPRTEEVVPMTRDSVLEAEINALSDYLGSVGAGQAAGGAR